MWTLLRIAGVYLAIGILIAKAIQWVDKRPGETSRFDSEDYVCFVLFWPVVIPLAVLALIFAGLEKLFE